MLSAILSIAATVLQQPSAPRWELRSEADRCVLHPLQADGFTLAAKPLSDTVAFIPSVQKNLPSRPTMATVIITPSGSEDRAEYHPATPGHAASVELSRSLQGKLIEGNSFTVAVEHTPLITVSSAGLGKGLAAVGQCTADILDRMGYKKGEPAPVPPGGWEADAKFWVTSRDYPFDAARAHRGGRMLLGWIVGVDGHIRNCTVLAFSGEPTLGPAACRAVTRRGRYVPAKDDRDQPIETFESVKFVFAP